MSGRIIPESSNRQDWPRLVAQTINKHSREAGGFGWADYSDASAGTGTAMTAGTALQITRTLAPTAANNRVRGPFLNWVFWDNAAHVIRPRRLYDVLAMSIYIKVTPGATGGNLVVALVAGTLEIASKAFPMTGVVGADMGLRVDFLTACRATFLANGAKVMLTSTVSATLKEFSPEFYPLGYES